MYAHALPLPAPMPRTPARPAPSSSPLIQDVVHEDLTVRENLAYSARLRLAAAKPARDKAALVEDCIDLLQVGGRPHLCMHAGRQADRQVGRQAGSLPPQPPSLPVASPLHLADCSCAMCSIRWWAQRSAEASGVWAGRGGGWCAGAWKPQSEAGTTAPTVAACAAPRHVPCAALCACPGLSIRRLLACPLTSPVPCTCCN
mgnify:CR=1 FL=1